MKRSIGSLVLVACWIGAPLAADEMRVDPGKWEFEIKSTNPMMGTRTHTQTDCIEEANVSPERFLEGDADCRIIDPRVSGTRMSWKLECRSPAGHMTGAAECSSTGTTVTGRMDMQMEAQGTKLSMSNEWTGRRLGDCD